MRRDTVQHASEIQFLESVLADLDTLSEEKLPQLTQKVKDRIIRLQTGAAPAQSAQSGPVSEDSRSSENYEERPLRHQFAELPLDNTDTPLLTAIEHLAWGRNSAGCFPHRRCSCQYRRDSPELLSINGGHFQIHGSALESMVHIPKVADARKLIKFHVGHLTWHHNCFHGPTFLEQCELFWRTGRCDHPLWMALYFSVLACTVNSIQDSAKLRRTVDVDLYLSMQPVQLLFSAMIQTLYNSHFLNDLSLYSVQAIVISTEVAHNLGLSQLNATLFNAAVRIAECLGVHKIKEHTSNSIQSKEEWEERVEREVGKRVWCQMVIQDHFAIPFTDTYSISPMHFSTGRPLNADERNLAELPTSVPTISTYVRVLVELAALMPGLADGLGPMTKRKPRREQYEHVLRIDQKMRAIVNSIPPFLLRADQAKEAQIPWLGIARRSLAITAAEKIIMIHRPFLFRSFHDPTYSHSRRTCVAAAMTILREHEAIVEEDDLSIWTHTAFAITASVILCFEGNALLKDPNNEKVEIYREAVAAARERLASRECDVLAQRGVALIDAISIAEGSCYGPSDMKPGASIDVNRIFANFSTLSRLNLSVNAEDVIFGKFPADSPEGLPGVEGDEMQLAWNQEEIDFDSWFNEVFNNFQGPPI